MLVCAYQAYGDGLFYSQLSSLVQTPKVFGRFLVCLCSKFSDGRSIQYKKKKVYLEEEKSFVEESFLVMKSKINLHSNQKSLKSRKIREILSRIQKKFDFVIEIFCQKSNNFEEKMSANCKCILFATTILCFLGLSTRLALALTITDGFETTRLQQCREGCLEKVCFEIYSIWLFSRFAIQNKDAHFLNKYCSSLKF